MISNKKIINVGIIGKNFGYNVIYRALLKHKKFKVLSFSYKNFREKIKLPKKVKIISSWKKQISDKKLDVIFICTPPIYHKDIINFAIKKNKHIFCEKPVTNSYAQIYKILKIIDKKKITHYVNYEFQNIEAFNYFKNKILKKILIKNIEINWFIKFFKRKSSWKDNTSKGGGVYYNYICHALYYIENLFGKISLKKLKVNKEKNFIKIRFKTDNKNIPLTFSFKLLKESSKIKPMHEIKIKTNKDEYLLRSKIENIYDQFILKKNNIILYKPKLNKDDFRLKPTLKNIDLFYKSILLNKSLGPNFIDAQRIHFIVKKLINS
jgi:predicted dehydrogenase